MTWVKNIYNSGEGWMESRLEIEAAIASCLEVWFIHAPRFEEQRPNCLTNFEIETLVNPLHFFSHSQRWRWRPDKLGLWRAFKNVTPYNDLFQSFSDTNNESAAGWKRSFFPYLALPVFTQDHWEEDEDVEGYFHPNNHAPRARSAGDLTFPQSLQLKGLSSLQYEPWLITPLSGMFWHEVIDARHLISDTDTDWTSPENQFHLKVQETDFATKPREDREYLVTVVEDNKIKKGCLRRWSPTIGDLEWLKDNFGFASQLSKLEKATGQGQ